MLTLLCRGCEPSLPFWQHSLPSTSHPYPLWLLVLNLSRGSSRSPENGMKTWKTNHLWHKRKHQQQDFRHLYSWQVFLVRGVSSENFLLLKEANSSHLTAHLLSPRLGSTCMNSCPAPVRSGLSGPNPQQDPPAQWRAFCSSGLTAGNPSCPEETESFVLPGYFINRTHYSLILLYICNTNN